MFTKTITFNKWTKIWFGSKMGKDANILISIVQCVTFHSDLYKGRT